MDLELDLSTLFNRSATTDGSKTIAGQQYLQLVLPNPYNTRTQVNVKNYRSEIDFICKRKNIPKDLQDYIVIQFEKNILKLQQSTKKQHILPNSWGINADSINKKKLQTTKASIQSTQLDNQIYIRQQQRDKKKIINLSSAIFKHVSKQIQNQKINPYNNKSIKKITPNPNIYNKLYHQNYCNKISCNQGHQIKQFIQIQQLSKIQQKPIINHNSRKLMEKNPHRNNQSIYQRLFKQSIKRQIKKNKKLIDLNQSIDSLKIPHFDKQYNKHFIKDHRPFLQRIQDQIENRKKKSQFLSHKYIDFSQNLQLFKPSIRSNAKSRVYNFMNKSLQIIKDSSQIIHKSKNNLQLLNRSIQLAKCQNQKYLQNLIRKLFPTGKLVLDAQSIGLLGDQQFTIIYPFLSKIQADLSISQSHFQEAFEQFYDKLPISEKHTLKSAQNKKTIKQKSLSNQSTFNFKPKIDARSRKIATQPNYQKILDFV